jgi:riboflavin kinase/FMN adenylyltransferase
LLFLTTIEERIELLKQEGVDVVIMLSFTPELAQIGARQFVSFLQKHLRMRGLIIGADFALGKRREGDTEALRKLGEEMGFTVSVVPPLVLNGEIVSSTAIRQALAAGDMRKARELAGRPFSLHGKVVTGAGRGEGLGFPTANIEVGPEHALPPDGVYATRAHINGNAYPSMTNIGQCPTFGGCQRTIETFLLDYQGDLYGRDLKIDIIDRLRDEKKFGSVDELKAQVAEDVSRGRKLLSEESESD